MKKTTRIILGLVFIVTILFSIPAIAKEVRTSSISPDGKIVEQYEGEREGAIKIGNELHEEYGKRMSSVWIRIDEDSTKLCVSIDPKKQRKCFVTMEMLVDRDQFEKERKELEKDGWQITSISAFKRNGGKEEHKIFCVLQKTVKY